MQQNWIGRSEGTLVDFDLGERWDLRDRPSPCSPRAWTRSMATSVQLAPEHPIVVDMIARDAELRVKVNELIASSAR